MKDLPSNVKKKIPFSFKIIDLNSDYNFDYRYVTRTKNLKTPFFPNL